ncbi:MAG: methyltransferase domain-containing protein [Bacteroidia bacterium]|nr:methyltransferase domain-containing protein [Bacteroidia bacterium]
MRHSAIYNILYKLLNYIYPQYFTELILTELVIFRTRLSKKTTRRRFIGQEELLVNIGAGSAGKNGWINMDAINNNKINCLWDCRKNLPFGDNSVKAIFTEHFIEHLDYDVEIPLLFSDMYRVIKPGGIIRIIVPDAEKYMRAYLQSGWNELEKVRPLIDNHVDYYSKKTMNTKMELVNFVFRQDYQHKFAYDFETLKYKLAEAGFKKIVQQNFNQSLNPELIIDTPERASESLYVEAVRE